MDGGEVYTRVSRAYGVGAVCVGFPVHGFEFFMDGGVEAVGVLVI